MTIITLVEQQVLDLAKKLAKWTDELGDGVQSISRPLKKSEGLSLVDRKFSVLSQMFSP